MADFTFKDICLILQMGANGFGIDDVIVDEDGVQHIKLSRWENTGSGVTEAGLIQTEDGLKIENLDLPEEELLEQEEVEAKVKADILSQIGIEVDDKEENENVGPLSKIRPIKLAANLRVEKSEDEDESETSQG